MNTKQTLFETEQRLQEAMDDLVFSEGHPDAHETALTVVKEYMTTAEAKRDRVAMFLKRAASEADFLEAQAVALADKAARLRKGVAGLNEYVLKVMDFMGVRELKGEMFKLCTVQNPSHVEIVDDKEIPVEYVRRRVTESPDKQRIKAALEAGEEVPGATLAPGQYRLVIR